MPGLSDAQTMVAFTRAVEDSTRALDGFARGVGRGGGFGGADRPGAGPGFAGGAAEEGGGIGGVAASIANPLLATGVGAAAAAASAIGGAALSAVGSGLITQSRGGDFGEGAIGQLNQIVGALPFVGEFSGIAAANRAESGVVGQLNALTDPIARFGGDPSGLRSALAPYYLEQQQRIEANHEQNSIAAQSARQESGAPSVTNENVETALTVAGFLTSPIAAAAIALNNAGFDPLDPGSFDFGAGQ